MAAAGVEAQLFEQVAVRAAGAVLLLAVLAPVGPACAQDADTLWNWCFGDAPDDRTIQGCNAVIATKRGTDENQAGAYYNRGVAHRNKGQLQEALKDYGESIRVNPADPDVFYNRGVVEQSLGQIDAAMNDYDAALKLKPAFPQAFNNRGVMHRLKKEYEAALKDFDQALRLDPRHAGAYNNRCTVRAITGQLKEAVADCDESLKLRASADALASRGLANLKLGQLDAAIRDYDAALKLTPNMPEGLFGRGVAKRKKGDTAGGDADIAAARAKRADVAELYASWGVSP
jgi:tetratricopeptide (TPR) repeat protein